MRDEFNDYVKRTVAHRAGNRCSNPECRTLTSGPHTDPTKSISLGVAAHITAASEGGPRYNSSFSSEERKHASNAVWFCQNCAKLIDSDVARYTEITLKRWKGDAEREAQECLGKTAASVDPTQRSISREELELLDAAAEDGYIHVLSTAQTGEFVRAGSRDFFDETDSAVAAVYREALDSLRGRGLARHEAGAAYRLTGTGFKIARAIATSSPKHGSEGSQQDH